MPNPCPSKEILEAMSATGEEPYVIQRFYCKAMNMRGKCTMRCMECKANLDEIYARSRAIGARKFPAVLTYNIRDWIAAMDEKKELPSELPRTWLGEVDNRNPFEFLAEAIT